MDNSLSLLRLCQLVSPALPVGAYNFSQGLEYAVHVGWVEDEPGAREWIGGVMRHAIASLDAPVLMRLHDAWRNQDQIAITYWNASLIAARESEELRAEERHLGRSLAKVLVSLDINDASTWTRSHSVSYACMFALAAVRWDIARNHAVQGYLWAWCENQVLAALKLLPIGQSAGQRMLNALLEQIPALADEAASIVDEDIGVSTPLQGMACAWHETQYSRLFRS